MIGGGGYASARLVARMRNPPLDSKFLKKC
jgi:hypothetical protein